MKNRLALTVACTIVFGTCAAQNFSGLQNKKLNRIDDVGSLLETQISNLFGSKLAGKVDSVVITYDAEKTLKGKIYYTEYINGFFTVSVINAAKQRQRETTIAKFSQASQASPFEFTLQLTPDVPKGTNLESAFLRIDVAKKDGGTGNVNVYALNKRWKNELDPQNVIISAVLLPVGDAVTLSNTQAVDVVPSNKIIFNPNQIYYQPQKAIKTNMIRRGGINSMNGTYHYDMFDDISGTWNNTDPNQSGLVKLIITDNNRLQAFNKCSTGNCDWGTVALTDLGGNNFKAVFVEPNLTTTLAINYAGGLLYITQTRTSKMLLLYNRPVSYTFRKELLFMMAKIYTLRQLPPVNTAPSNTDDGIPKGPNNITGHYFLLEGLSSYVDFDRPQEICNINMNVYQDKSDKSGIWYILPADYHLKWEAKTESEKGYGLHILYGGTKSNDGSQPVGDAAVRMSATLTAGISTHERDFIASFCRLLSPNFKRLQFLPLKENPRFTFQNTLGAQYNIPQDKITIETSTDLDNDIKVSWQTDADTKEFIQAALTSRDGISASVILKPDNDDIPEQQIPAIINLADIRTLGKISMEPGTWRTTNWRNTTPYPLKLKYLHILKKQIGGIIPIIYSWSMNDVLVPPKAQVAFDNSRVPPWLDTDSSVVMWIDYDIEECLTCDQKVMDAVTGGVSGTKAQMVKFSIPVVVFDSLNASAFLIKVRSRQVDPNGTEVKELASIRVTNDDKEYPAGPLYIPSGGTIEFEYKVIITTKDGDVYSANDWIRGTDKDVVLGKSKLKEIFRGIVPGIN